MDKQALIEQFIDVIETDKELRKAWQLKVQKSRSINMGELRKLIQVFH